MRRLQPVVGALAAVAVVATVLLHPTAAIADSCVNDPACVTPDPESGAGFPFSGVLPLVVVLLVAVGFTTYRVSVARSMAQKAGLDPADATRVALLDQDGVSATYLASQLRREHEQPQAGPTARSAADRLRELEDLLAQGLVTDQEYAQRRTAIIGGV